jgi:hypothetical protein
MSRFEWDESKNESNKLKHKVAFEEAREIFDDNGAIEFLGSKGTEVRFLRIGKTVGKIMLAVVYTLRQTVIRIISARQAGRGEINAYLEQKFTKIEDDENRN